MVYDPNLNPGINWRGLYEGRDSNGNPIPQGERERNLIYEYNQRAKAQNLPEIPYTARKGIPQYVPVRDVNQKIPSKAGNWAGDLMENYNKFFGGAPIDTDAVRNNELLNYNIPPIDNGLNLPVELQNISPSGLVALEQYLRGDLA